MVNAEEFELARAPIEAVEHVEQVLEHLAGRHASDDTGVVLRVLLGAVEGEMARRVDGARAPAGEISFGDCTEHGIRRAKELLATGAEERYAHGDPRWQLVREMCCVLSIELVRRQAERRFGVRIDELGVENDPDIAEWTTLEDLRDG